MKNEFALFDCAREFLCNYLPKQRNASGHTVRAYRTSLRLCLESIAAAKSKRLRDLTFDDIDMNGVIAFLDGLETGRLCHVRTRNLRLNAIRSFMTYCGSVAMENVGIMNRLSEIPLKKEIDRDPVKFVSEKAMTALLAAPDAKTRQGRRDRALLSMLYDTAARVHEILDVKISDIDLSGSTVVLHGKGGKSRIVPLMKRTVEILVSYIREFHQDKDGGFLFYTEGRLGRRRMTEDNARCMLRKYGAIARKTCNKVPNRIHPHLFRHSRAMHLYSNGMDLTLVSQLLGHAQFETTLIYARAGTEQKRTAIEAATPADSPLRTYFKGIKAKPCDDETILKLYGLK